MGLDSWHDDSVRRKAEIEEKLRAELQAARIAFMDVTDQYRRTIALVEDLGPNSPEGTKPWARLRRSKVASSAHYCAALRDSDDFILRRIITERLCDSS